MNQKADDLLNAGNLLAWHGNHETALRLYDYSAEASEPDSPEAWNALKNKAVAKLVKKEDVAWATKVLLNHVERYPKDFIANLHLSQIMCNKFRVEESLRYALAAVDSLTVEPPTVAVDAYLRLSHAYHCAGWHDDAVRCHEKAVELVPTNMHYRMWLGMDQILVGNYEEGLKNYRCRESGLVYQPKLLVRYDGKELPNNICLSTEQGAGDVIMGMRAAREYKARGVRRIGVLVGPYHEHLMEVLRYFDGVDEIFWHENEELAVNRGYTHYIPVLSTIEGPSLSCTPYLKPPQSIIDMKREFKGEVGVCWRGNPDHANDFLRRVDGGCILKMAGHLDPVPVQYGILDGEEKRFPKESPKLHPKASFLEQAAVIANLRLLVTVDTAAGHLAGAMGVPCIVLVSAFSDWRWGLPGKVEPVWYDSVKVIRQTKCGTWEGDIDRVKEIIDKGLAQDE